MANIFCGECAPKINDKKRRINNHGKTAHISVNIDSEKKVMLNHSLTYLTCILCYLSKQLPPADAFKDKITAYKYSFLFYRMNGEAYQDQ